MATKFTDAEKAQMDPNTRILAEINEAYDRGDRAAGRRAAQAARDPGRGADGRQTLERRRVAAGTRPAHGNRGTEVRQGLA